MVLAVLVAAVAAAPQFLPYAGYSPLAYSAGLPYAAAPTFAYGVAPVAYSAPVAHVAAPLPYVAPGPISYQTGAKVVAKYEPVEQHGYSIAY